jgi:4-amino-4-deoxy-L-arabinose transferase-like glycosyltransferase
MTGQPFEFEAADAAGYHNEAIWMSQVIKDGQWNVFWEYYHDRLSDMGYPLYLAVVYSVFGQAIIIARIIKAILSSITVVLIYKIASRNFGEKTGRMAGVLAFLYPNLIYYCGLHVKETEMVFILSLFMERADFLLRSKKFSYLLLIWVVLLGASLYFFRAVLAYSVFIALALALLFSSRRVLKFKKKMLFIFTTIIIIGLLTSSSILAEAFDFWEARTSNQSLSLEVRTQTNVFSKYASALIFAPFVFIAPFPTLVDIESQQNHMLLGGAFYVKNILAFFVIIALVSLLKKQAWRKHVLILAFLVTYLSILAMSKYAIVERFHMPALSVHIMLTAYGISQLNRKNVEFFKYYLFIIALFIIGWNWMKLAGRGLN